jgi:hypothetical protein
MKVFRDVDCESGDCYDDDAPKKNLSDGDNGAEIALGTLA